MSRDIDDEVRCYRLANGNCPSCARPRHDGMTCDYARGKADGLAEAIAWLRRLKNLAADVYADAIEDDALERGEHKK